MSNRIKNYKCLACDGPLKYDGATQKLTCEYCDSSYDIAQIEDFYGMTEELEATEEPAPQPAEEAPQWQEEETKGLVIYTCPSCGAELICDEHTAATSCVYCGNPTIVPSKFSGVLKPEFIIPFKKTKEEAEAALKNFYKGKKFLPGGFASENRIHEIKGVYVPFWLYDGKAAGDMTFHATRSNVRIMGDYRITTTYHYTCKRKGDIPFTKIPADGSSKMEDQYMDAIEPYDYSEMQPFTTAYIPGYFADKYDVEADANKEHIEGRMSNTMQNELRNTVRGYESCNATSSSVHISYDKISYALLPVWMLNTKWNGQMYTFAMNGQTGRLVGNLPIDKKKYWAWFAGIFAACSAICTILTGVIFL